MAYKCKASTKADLEKLSKSCQHRDIYNKCTDEDAKEVYIVTDDIGNISAAVRVYPFKDNDRVDSSKAVIVATLSMFNMGNYAIHIDGEVSLILGNIWSTDDRATRAILSYMQDYFGEILIATAVLPSHESPTHDVFDLAGFVYEATLLNVVEAGHSDCTACQHNGNCKSCTAYIYAYHPAGKKVNIQVERE